MARHTTVDERPIHSSQSGDFITAADARARPADMYAYAFATPSSLCSAAAPKIKSILPALLSKVLTLTLGGGANDQGVGCCKLCVGCRKFGRGDDGYSDSSRRRAKNSRRVCLWSRPDPCQRRLCRQNDRPSGASVCSLARRRLRGLAVSADCTFVQFPAHAGCVNKRR